MRLGRFRLLFLTSVAISIATCAHAQSLGDIARKEQAKKGAPKSSKVITNDDLDSLRRGPDQITTASGNTAKPSDPTASASKEENQADTAKSDSAESKGDAMAGDSQSASGGDKDSVEAGWKAKISDQKSKIELLEREIDVMQREQKLRATTYYADAGNRLRDSKCMKPPSLKSTRR